MDFAKYMEIVVRELANSGRGWHIRRAEGAVRACRRLVTACYDGRTPPSKAAVLVKDAIHGMAENQHAAAGAA